MTSLRPFHATDVFKFNPTNLDPLTETYDLNFYFSYLARWPHLFTVALSPSSSSSIRTISNPTPSHPNPSSTPQIAAYIMGKTESSPTPSYYTRDPEHHLPWHAHITALTVAPHARRLGLARTLSNGLEEKGDEYDAWFVDLFVRKSNRIAQELYKGLGYSVFRVVKGYYSDDPNDDQADGEDAYDMRKRLKRDVDGKHSREDGENYEVMPEDVW